MDIPDGYEIIPCQAPERETEKAYAFEMSLTGRLTWIPKSVVTTSEDPTFGTIYFCKTWFISRNRLWNLFNLKVEPCN